MDRWMDSHFSSLLINTSVSPGTFLCLFSHIKHMFYITVISTWLSDINDNTVRDSKGHFHYLISNSHLNAVPDNRKDDNQNCLRLWKQFCRIAVVLLLQSISRPYLPPASPVHIGCVEGNPISARKSSYGCNCLLPVWRVLEKGYQKPTTAWGK